MQQLTGNIDQISELVWDSYMGSDDPGECDSEDEVLQVLELYGDQDYNWITGKRTVTARELLVHYWRKNR